VHAARARDGRLSSSRESDFALPHLCVLFLPSVDGVGPPTLGSAHLLATLLSSRHTQKMFQQLCGVPEPSHTEPEN